MQISEGASPRTAWGFDAARATQESMSSERRADARVGFPVLVLFRAQATEQYTSAYGADLSINGLRVDGAEAEEGTMLDLQLIERHGRRPIEVLGEVLRSDASGFSLRFVELDDGQRAWLDSVVSGRQSKTPLAAETEDLLVAGFEDA